MKELWTTVHGGWGDAIASYGNIRALLAEKNADKANVVFFGIDTDIILFLKAQKNIGKVRHLQIHDKSEYYDYSVMGILDFPLFTRMTGLHDQFPELIPTHISDFYQSKNPNLCHRYFDVNTPLSNSSLCELNSSLCELPKEPFVLMQPFSCYSCKQKDHWTYWLDALSYVLDNCSHKVVLVGQSRSLYDVDYKFPNIEHTNLINLVGKTSSMIEVLHIMNQATCVLSTSNALSMWSIVTRKPALIVCNQIIDNSVVRYYYNWINHEPNLLLNSNTALSEFKTSFLAFEKRIFNL